MNKMLLLLITVGVFMAISCQSHNSPGDVMEDKIKKQSWIDVYNDIKAGIIISGQNSSLSRSLNRLGKPHEVNTLSREVTPGELRVEEIYRYRGAELIIIGSTNGNGEPILESISYRDKNETINILEEGEFNSEAQHRVGR